MCHTHTCNIYIPIYTSVRERDREKRRKEKRKRKRKQRQESTGLPEREELGWAERGRSKMETRGTELGAGLQVPSVGNHVALAIPNEVQIKASLFSLLLVTGLFLGRRFSLGLWGGGRGGRTFCIWIIVSGPQESHPIAAVGKRHVLPYPELE